MKLIDGSLISKKIKQELREEILVIKQNGNRSPCFIIILVGDDTASKLYVNSKIDSCKEIGFDSKLIELPEDISEENLLKEVENLNNNKNVDGFIVQLPLPKHINEQKIIEKISPNKDVDGFHPVNIGRLLKGSKKTIQSVVSYAVLEVLHFYDIDINNKNIVVIGRDNLVGIPVSLTMSNKKKVRNSTVTICHNYTEDITNYTKKADIIIIFIETPLFLKKEMIKEGVVIIDVGRNRVNDYFSKKGYRVCGDVDFEDVKNKCSYITPVPGGMGPMTIAMLMKNTLNVYKNKF